MLFFSIPPVASHLIACLSPLPSHSPCRCQLPPDVSQQLGALSISRFSKWSLHIDLPCLKVFSVKQAPSFYLENSLLWSILQKILAITMQSSPMFSGISNVFWYCHLRVTLFLPFTYPVRSFYFWLVFSLTLAHNSTWDLFIETINTSEEPLLSCRVRSKNSTGLAKIVYV